MPELPEVEVTRLGLQSLPGRRVTRIECGARPLRVALPCKLLDRHILGGRFAAVDRRAKYLLFRMGSGAVLLIHLGMTGKLSLVPTVEPCALHDHLRLQLDNGMDLRFNDSRRFGSVTVWPAVRVSRLEKAFSARLGVEPFGPGFTTRHLLERSRSKKQPVKNFLMDSRVIAGIGNIYANEILFAAAIHPHTPAGALSAAAWQRIIRSTRRILKTAIEAGGSTIADFLGTGGNPGYFQLHFEIYDRQGKPCLRCGTAIAKCTLGGRATYFCPVCQPAPAGIGSRTAFPAGAPATNKQDGSPSRKVGKGR
ncbi:MAG TPA: bifunctional DNA-formamidopyrimidine glycosylase/DNA-(apurinic or apyrimidinic site) lyase [Desulfobacteraceae bacterium]|nr:bifunctional DNA-formamidopyrimidine glycosylase/DNA-(apurinic or apyrimidinic site) lyase [Desulfobacteraceae bacterium]